MNLLTASTTSLCLAHGCSGLVLQSSSISRLSCCLLSWCVFSGRGALFMRRTPCHKGMSSCYYLKNLFVRAAQSHLRQFFPFLFCLCCPVCWCRVYGRYTAGRSETLLQTAMVFSISFKKATLIPVRCLMYLLKCTCFSLCGRSAMSPVPISFQCHWERP